MTVNINGNGTITPTTAVQPAGSVLQVQYSQSQANMTQTSSSYQNYSAINTAITPIASNSLLVAQLDLGCFRVYENNSNSAFAVIALSDDAGSSYLFENYQWVYDYGGSGISASGLRAGATHVKISGSTSARTYYVYTKLSQGDAYEINPGANENIATLTIWEIAQ